MITYTAASLFQNGSTLPVDFLASRRDAIISARDRVVLAHTDPIEMAKRLKAEHEAAKFSARFQRGSGKPPTERLETMIRKSELLMAEMKSAQLATVFALKRDRYYSERSAAIRYAREKGLPVPDLPMAPESHFPGAKPRGRWVA